MKTINLRWIYPHYRHDEFVEVSDEVWEVMRQAQREMNNYERRKVYHRAWYSLDAYSWTENYALEHGRSPEDILVEREERAARLRLVAALPGAVAYFVRDGELHSPNPLCAPRSQTPASRLFGSTEPEISPPKGGATHRFLPYSRQYHPAQRGPFRCGRSRLPKRNQTDE